MPPSITMQVVPYHVQFLTVTLSVNVNFVGVLYYYNNVELYLIYNWENQLYY